MSHNVKNIDIVEGTYKGEILAAGDTYIIPVGTEMSWATDDDVLDGIINNKLQVDGLTGSAIQLAALNGSTPSDTDGVPLARQRAFSNADNMRFRGTGVSGTPLKTTTTNIDFAMIENRFINGLEFIVNNHVFGDSAKFQVVDVDNLLGYGAGLVLDEFGTDWYVAEDTQRQGPYILPYPALVSVGLYLRIVYNSVGTVNDVDLKINYFLHKKAT